MPSFPINVQLAGRLVVIAGGGNVALRKATALRAAGAHVRVVAPKIDIRFDELAPCERIRREFEASDLTGAALAIAATDHPEANALICDAARAAGILCSNVSEPHAGDFTMPAVLRIDDVTITADTGGASPAFAKRIISDIGRKVDPNYGRAAAALRVMRDYALGVVPPAQRAAVMQEASAMEPERLAALGTLDAQHEIDSIVERARGVEPASATGTVTCASRASKLAMAQTRTVAAALARCGLATTIVPVSTLGDRVTDRPLAAIGAESLFVKELELALRDGRASYAVHSCKDLPSVLPHDMAIVAVTTREDPRDALCSERFESFAALPPGARVGTSSLRRRAQLLALRPDLEYADIRGNVDTRLRKLRDGEFDAIVLAMAGLNRLGTSARFTVPFDPADVVPATGQGALAIEMCAGETGPQRELIRTALNDPKAELEIVAERAALAALRGGCQAPVGIHARAENGMLRLEGIVVSPDGSHAVRARVHEAVNSAGNAVALGERLAAQLTASGAEEILGSLRQGAALRGKRIVVPRTQERPSRLAAALEAEGATVVQWRLGEAAPADFGEASPDMIVFPSSGSVGAAASLLDHLRGAPQKPAVAAMGPASASAASAAGFPPDVVADQPEIGPLVAAVRAFYDL